LKIKSVLFTLLLVTLMLTFSSAFAESTTITDILGREITLEVPPELVVLTGKKTATIIEAPFMFAYGKDHVATSWGGQDGGKFNALIEKTTPEITDGSVEAVAAMQPNMIILKSYTREDAGLAFEETGIPVMYLSFETIEDYHTDIANLGKAFGEEERADEILAYYDEIVNRVAENSAQIADRKKTLLVQFSETDGVYALKVPPVSWLQTEIVEMAGGDPVWKDIGLNANSWSEVNFEQIAAWDPEVILVVNYFADPKVSVETLKSEPGWDMLTAVKEGQIYPFGKDLLSWDSASPRWGLGLLWTQQTLYPELADDIDLDAEIMKFYQWFGLSDEVIQANLIDVYHAEPELVP